LDASRYLASLWDATTFLAAGAATPEGCRAALEIRTVESIAEDESLRLYDAVVIACGAAAGSVSELSGDDALPTRLQGGHVVELVPKRIDGTVAWPTDAPGILGSPYVAPLGPHRVLVGTTTELDASVSDARRAGEVSIHGCGSESSRAAAAAAELVERASAIYPPFASDLDDWAVEVTRYGVRANPPRSNLGSLPLIGRIAVKTSSFDAPHGQEKTSPSWWYVGGLGARGLVYHGVLGEILAEAVLADDDTRVPRELRFDPGSHSTKRGSRERG
jgi:glycine/D-amino acid oxidase-like deaminating enzyme